MHQTFYIDIDEEITSIVDRLRKSKTDEVVIVVPKRALLIQSIVNLKLLKKESEGLGKRIVIVTQDKLGKLLVEKTGISVEQKLDDVEGEEISVAPAKNNDDLFNMEKMDLDSGIDAKGKMENIGSTDYFEDDFAKIKPAVSVAADFRKNSPVKAKKEREILPEKISDEEEEILNKELVTDIGKNIRKKSVFGRSASMDIIKNIDIRQSGFPDEALGEERGGKARKKVGKKNLDFRKENLESKAGVDEGEKIEEFFQINKEAKKKKDDYGDVSLSGGFWKFFLIFGSVAAVVIALVVAYLFLPKADIKIFTKTKVQTVDAEIKGQADVSSVDLEKQIIPSRIVNASDELSGKFDATGEKSASSQKARGTITIYNEYSASPQPLIATTRFLSESGKIFRLVKSVAVPGTTMVGGSIQPGAIEADVVADESGDAYNIGPEKFTIPGFQGSGNEKYSKFYAKSFKAMVGGGSGESIVKTIAGSDISNAKNKLLAQLLQSMRQKIKDAAGEDEIVLDDAINTSDATYTISNSEGEVADNFAVTVKVKASAVVFNRWDLKDAVIPLLAKAGNGNANIDKDSLSLEFGKSDADFSIGNILIRVNAKGSIKPNIDVENLKKGILGKTEDDFKAYLKAYSDIDRVEINYWPSFISGKIPAYESRIDIELDNNQQVR